MNWLSYGTQKVTRVLAELVSLPSVATHIKQASHDETGLAHTALHKSPRLISP